MKRRFIGLLIYIILGFSSLLASGTMSAEMQAPGVVKSKEDSLTNEESDILYNMILFQYTYPRLCKDENINWENYQKNYKRANRREISRIFKKVPMSRFEFMLEQVESEFTTVGYSEIERMRKELDKTREEPGLSTKRDVCLYLASLNVWELAIQEFSLTAKLKEIVLKIKYLLNR